MAISLISTPLLCSSVSEQRARNGEYLEAITMLFEPNVWRGLSMNNYNLWAAEIWHILVLRATRR